MKKVIIASLITASLIYANDKCDKQLKESMSITNSCLVQLDSNERFMQTVSTYSEDEIEFILEREEQVITENKALVKKNKKLSKEINKLKKEIVAVKDNSLSLQNQLLKQQKRLFAFKNKTKINKKKSSKLLAVLKDTINDKSELMRNNIYVVPVNLLNIRSGYSISYPVQKVVKKNSRIRFTDTKEIDYRGAKVVWLKTRFGWMFVPSVKDSKFLISLKQESVSLNSSNLAFSDISQDAGGGAR